MGQYMNVATPNIATPISMTSPPAMPAGTTLGVIRTPLGCGLPYGKIFPSEKRLSIWQSHRAIGMPEIIELNSHGSRT
jgi:hypothetical protein